MEYWPTDEILAEFFTKTMQGTLFEILRRVIMGWDHISILSTESMSELKDLVGNDQNGMFNPKID